jgi:hypothetical protein
VDSVLKSSSPVSYCNYWTEKLNRFSLLYDALNFGIPGKLIQLHSS